MKNRSKGIKKAFLGLLSAVGLFLVIWLLFFSKIKAGELLAPLLKKIPKDESALSNITEDILGRAVESVNSKNIKIIKEKGSEFFESSEYAEPAREIREEIINKVEEVIESAKELPAKEIKIIKRQVCKEWFEEIATEEGEIE